MLSRSKENIFMTALMVLVLCAFLAVCEGHTYTRAGADVAQQNKDIAVTMTANND